MNNEFIWNLSVDGENKIYKCVVKEDEVITYEGDTECKHLKITNKEKKQNVLQIDTVTVIYGMECPFQLENGVPYIKLGGKWTMSETTFEARKKKLIQIHKISAYVQVALGIAMGLACLIRYLVMGSMGSWWFLIILGSIMAITGVVQYKEIQTQMKELEKADA